MNDTLNESQRLVVCLVFGVLAGAGLSFLIEWELAALTIWDVTAASLTAWIWSVIHGLDPEQTQERSTREDPTRTTTRTLLVTACTASLVGVLYAFTRAGAAAGERKAVLIGVAVLTVVLSWTLVHTLFTLRYAHLYYSDEPGGIDFKNDEPPAYADFAYVAFTVGMTFQVADTDVQSPKIRRSVIRHAGLSYLFATIIVASAINVIASALK